MRASNIWNSGHLGKYIRYGVKGAVRKSLAMICDKLPEPTKENTRRANSHRLIDIRDHILSRDLEGADDKVIRGFFNLLIIVYDFDIFWRERIDRVVRLLIASGWEETEGSENPRYMWWLEKKDAPKNATLLDMLRMERFFARRESDGRRMLRLKVMQNIVEGLANGDDVHEEYSAFDDENSVLWKDSQWSKSSE